MNKPLKPGAIFLREGDPDIPTPKADANISYIPTKTRPILEPERDETETEVKPWPVLSDKALSGIVGDFVAMATKHSEADRAAVLLSFLAAFGAAAGRGRYLRIGDTTHHARLYVALVGNSSRARKGTSAAPVKRALQAAQAQLMAGSAPFPGGLPLKVSDGPMSSGEGIVWAIRDRSETKNKDGVPLDAGVEDKRILVIEGELGGALRAAGREGSILSAILRSAWDGGKIQPLVSGRSRAVVGASDPHLCVIGHITSAELAEVLGAVDVYNGLANRFLWACVRRGRELPFPQPMPDEVVDGIGERLAAALKLTHQGGEMTLSTGARELWASQYSELTQDLPGALGAVTARAEAQTLRLATHLALLDFKTFIDAEHLTQALAIWDYCRDSAAYLFGDLSTDQTVDEVFAIIKEAGVVGIRQSGIHEATGRHIKADRLGAVLSELQSAGKVTQETTKTQGRPVTTWRAFCRG